MMFKLITELILNALTTIYDHLVKVSSFFWVTIGFLVMAINTYIHLGVQLVVKTISMLSTVPEITQASLVSNIAISGEPWLVTFMKQANYSLPISESIDCFTAWFSFEIIMLTIMALNFAYEKIRG